MNATEKIPRDSSDMGLCIALAFIFSWALACPSAAAQDVLLVANKSVPISQITSTQVRELFTGVHSRFSDGSRAVPVTLKGGPTHEVFLRNYVGEDPAEFRLRWRKAVFTGQGAMLKELRSESDLLNYVSATPGAIGYVSRVTAADSVKVLTVLKSPY